MGFFRLPSRPIPVRLSLGLALFVSGVGLEAALMIHRALWLRGFGPICGQHAAVIHCPGCYAAMALAVVGAAVAAAPPAAARSRIR